MATLLGTVPLPGPLGALLAPSPAAAAGPTYQASVQADSPVLYYRLGEPAGSATVANIGGAGAAFNGTVRGGSALGRPGGILNDANTAIALNGVNADVLVPSPGATGPTFFTAEAWFKAQPTWTGTGFVASLVGVPGGFGLTAGKAFGKVTDSVGTVHQVTAAGLSNDAAWHHLAFSNDNVTLRLYVDGALVASAALGATLVYGANPGVIGSNGGAGYFNGSIDEAAAYASPLSLARLQAHVAAAGPNGGSVPTTDYPTGRSADQNSCHRSAGAPVNTATGNFWHTFTDFTIPGRGPGIALTRTYNSDLAAAGVTGPLGFGWSHSYDMRLSGLGTAAVAVHLEDGGESDFSASGGVFTAPPRVLAKLVGNGPADPEHAYTYTRRKLELFDFDTTGRLTRVRDRNGEATILAYSAARLATVASSGRTLTFAYRPADGLLDSVTDNASPARSVRFAYTDGAGNLTAATDVTGGVTSFTYRPDHRLVTMLDPNQQGAATPSPIVNDYDAAGRVDFQDDQLGRRTTFAYAATPASPVATTTVTDAKGNATVDEYRYGVLASTTKGAGTTAAATWSYSHDPDTLGCTVTTDPNGHTTTVVHDADGNRTSVKDALGRETTTAYNGFNQVTKVTDAKLVATTFAYDGAWGPNAGNLVTTSRPVIAPDATPEGTRLTTYNHADAAHPGDVTSVVDPESKTWTYAYDANGMPNVAVDPLLDKTTSVFDNVGRMLTRTRPRGNTTAVPDPAFTTTFAYDADNRPTSSSTPNPPGAPLVATRSYDANRNLRFVVDGAGRTTENRYDVADQLERVVRGPGSADESTQRNEYWPDGTVRFAFDGNGAPTSYAYDPLERLVTVTDSAVPARTTTYGYDPAGNLTTKMDPGRGSSCVIGAESQCTTYGYDFADELKTISYSDRPADNVTNVGYDPNGARLAMTDATGTSTWSWDSLGRLRSSTTGAGVAGGGQAVGYTYNLRNQVKTITYPGGAGVVERSYDEAGRWNAVKDLAGQTTNFGYDADDNLTTRTFPAPSGVVDTIGYDIPGRLADSTVAKGPATLATFAYGRDGADQVTSTTATGVPNDDHTYGYTNLNQLCWTGGAGEGGACAEPPAGATRYGYDPAENLTQRGNVSQAYDAARQLCWTGPAAGDCTAAPAAATRFGYDGHGNRTTVTPPIGPARTFGYDQANRLTASPALEPSQITGAGAFHTLAIRPDRTVWAWGRNINGQLGNGTTTDSTVPVQVSNLAGATAVAGGGFHSLAVRDNGTVWAWGRNFNGQLGNGTTTSSSLPVQVANLDSVMAVAGGGYHSLALKTDGTVWAWGRNFNGQLGNATTTGSPVPVQVRDGSGVLSGVVAVAAGSDHSLALKTDGTLWAWGMNWNGQLGNGVTNSGSSVAVRVTGLNDVVAIAAGDRHSVAVVKPPASTGTVWAWGSNSFGQLGNGSIGSTRVSLPVQVAGLSGVAAVGAGGLHSLAVKDDGSVWAWGYNNYGQLGDGSTATSPVPVQARELSGALAVAGGGDHSTAVKADGTMATWGRNNFGQLGNASTADALAPVAVPSLSLHRGATYAYDGDGLRLSKTTSAGKTTFAWDQAAGLPLLLTEATGTSATHYIYGPGGLPIAQVKGSQIVYYHQDQLGSTRLLTDASGNDVGTFTYDPYGTLVASTGSVSQPFGFAGEYTDAETGFQYLRARYYDPATGQFLTRDPIEASTRSSYGYTGGNPLNGTDPSGLYQQCPTGQHNDGFYDVCVSNSVAPPSVTTEAGNATGGAEPLRTASGLSPGNPTTYSGSSSAGATRGGPTPNVFGAQFCLVLCVSLSRQGGSTYFTLGAVGLGVQTYAGYATRCAPERSNQGIFGSAGVGPVSVSASHGAYPAPNGADQGDSEFDVGFGVGASAGFYGTWKIG